MNMTRQWTKAELEDWCRGWSRTPITTLKAFIDAGFCSDEAPSREEMRLLRQPTPSTVDMTKAVIPEPIGDAVKRLRHAIWDTRAIPKREDIRIVLDALRRERHPEPPKGVTTWYRGWECGFHEENARWGTDGWEAYLGGVDPDAHVASAFTWDGLLDEIDDHYMTEKAA